MVKPPASVLDSLESTSTMPPKQTKGVIFVDRGFCQYKETCNLKSKHTQLLKILKGKEKCVNWALELKRTVERFVVEDIAIVDSL